jgi:hypothetical protein
MNPITASAYVDQRGDPVQRARLRYIYYRQLPTDELLRQLLAGQRADGGWQPSWAPNYSSIDATCLKLFQAEQLGLGAGEPALIRALHFLTRRQQADGAWEEAPNLASLAPPMALPGSREARLFLTASSAYWLARLAPADMGSLRESAGRAAAVLITYLGGRDRLPSFMQTDWLAAGMWQCLGRTDLANRIYPFLESRVPEMSAGQMAWMIVTLRGAGLDASHPLMATAGMSLAALQSDDGRWASAEGPSRDVEDTLDALYALRQVDKL